MKDAYFIYSILFYMHVHSKEILQLFFILNLLRIAYVISDTKVKFCADTNLSHIHIYM